MKTLTVALALLGLGGCLFKMEHLTRSNSAEVPKESVQREVTARFQQGKPPEPGQLFVCAEVGTPPNPPEFWCLDYFLFQAKLRESDGKTGVTEL